ncbi:MAG: hypothetical protein WC109_04330 [Syntrophomonadaceae bacterium]|nr:hypothetical protein [Syntrophomonadaceae bacterium]MDD3897944.1 hypothetical protein [Syntrophomonadaceae bacterium]
MQYSIQVLFDTEVTASHPSIPKNIISYINRYMVPLCYKKPELLPVEISRALNNRNSRYHIMDSVPQELDDSQLFVDLEMEKSDELGVMYLHGRFKVFVSRMENPIIEDVFHIILNQGSRVEALNRRVYFNGELVDYKPYPRSKQQVISPARESIPRLA